MTTGHFPNLRAARERLGLTRNDLACNADCDEHTIRRAEGAISGKYAYGISLKVAVNIADAMGMGMDELLGRQVKMGE